ncbi:MAG: M14 family zinc carboxypeptidase [Phycisphaerae bacterium]
MSVKLATSAEGRPIEAYVHTAPARPTIMVCAGIHGDEPKSVHVARKLIELLDAGAEIVHESGSGWIVLPIVNPDGYVRRRRRNANAVDINRNFPTRNWTLAPRRSRMFGGTTPASEPETRAILDSIACYRPSTIVSIHSIDGNRECNNYDGPARAIAAAMHGHNGYPVAGSIGYPTPGSLGTWAGRERRIPVITLELPSRHSAKRCWEDNRQGFICLGAGIAPRRRSRCRTTPRREKLRSEPTCLRSGCRLL